MLSDRELQTLRNQGNEAEAAVDEIERLRKVLQAFAGVEDFAGWHDKYQPAIALARAALSNHQSTSMENER